VEAVLGGRVQIETPGGVVWLTIPPGTSSHAKLRLRNKGPVNDAGTRGDLQVIIRIVVPRDMDEESTKLLRRFADLNPTLDEG
jgi:curved DNA-binding protein